MEPYWLTPPLPLELPTEIVCAEGGADRRKPSDYNRAQLQRGTKVEMEHTSDARIAREIAMDHLEEDPNYYKKLALIDPH